MFALRHFAVPFLAAVFSLHASAAESSRIRELIDPDWKFLVGDPAKAADPAFDDSAWRTVTLPHDWSIEGKPDAKNPMGGQGGFFPAGLGWYRRPLTIPASWSGKRVSVEFEGVYMNSEVWLNGERLNTQPYGYTSFIVDLTSHLKADGENLLAVKVDNSKHKNTRWYSGSGIYRHVWLTATDPVHVAPRGVFITTPKADANVATISVETKLANESAKAANVTLVTTLIGADGKSAATVSSSADVAAGLEQTIHQEISLPHPSLWSPETPTLYRAVTEVRMNGKTVDELETKIGVRTLAWSADKGLLLNGTPLKLNGGCIHHDNGVLGAMAFDRAEERKIELLKASGFNEIRTAHNPPSPALLDACDRLGMLVMDEAFDCWAKGKNSADYGLYFKDWWERDLDSMVLRDRNHPSVIFWSLGNEVPDLMAAMGQEYGPKLAARVHSLDTTRPVTNGILGWPDETKKPGSQAAADANWNSLDIVGSNYGIGNHIKQHDQFPNRLLMVTESSPGNPSNVWRQVMENVFVVGDNVWSAQDYLGECGVGRSFYIGDPSEPINPPKDPQDTKLHPVMHGSDSLYPWRGANPGDLDLLGDRKPMAHWRNIVWDKGEKLYLAVRQPEDEKPLFTVGWGWHPTFVNWTWPGREGKQTGVEVYSRYETVRLYLNDKLVEERKIKPADGFRSIFNLPYQPGTLKVVGVEDGKETGSFSISTAGEPAKIRLTPDRTTIHSGEQDLSFINVEALDKNGQPQPNADALITFTVSGPGVIAGLGNANLKSEEMYQGTQCHFYHGRALIVIRSKKETGAVSLQAESPGLTSASVKIAVE